MSWVLVFSTLDNLWIQCKLQDIKRLDVPETWCAVSVSKNKIGLTDTGLGNVFVGETTSFAGSAEMIDSSNTK